VFESPDPDFGALEPCDDEQCYILNLSGKCTDQCVCHVLTRKALLIRRFNKTRPLRSLQNNSRKHHNQSLKNPAPKKSRDHSSFNPSSGNDPK